MRFYCVTWQDEGSPEGRAGEYFRRKRDAERKVRELTSPVAMQCPCCDDWLDPKSLGYCDECEAYTVDFNDVTPVHLEVLDFRGTPKEMVWDALHHQIIPG
jgi:hypothetical protein